VAVEELFSGLFNNEVPCKLLSVRSPLAVKFTEITALVSFSISNDVGRVKELGLLVFVSPHTRFPAAHTHWSLSRA
jgi:hypothetical protein